MAGDRLTGSGAVARVTPEFYRKEVVRLLELAYNTRDAQTRIELLEMASRFREMAAHLEGWDYPDVANINDTAKEQKG